MKRITYLMVTLLALLLAAPVSATTGWDKCNSTQGQGALQPGESACNNPVIGDLDSKIIDIGACAGTVTAIYNADTTGTAQDTTVQILTCVTPVCSAETCVPIENFILTGAAEAAEIYGIQGRWICVDGTTDPLSGDTPRVLIQCN